MRTGKVKATIEVSYSEEKEVNSKLRKMRRLVELLAPWKHKTDCEDENNYE